MTTSAQRAIIIMAVLLATASLHLAGEFLIPVSLALVLVSVLWPVVQAMARRRIPSTVGAAICIVGTIAILAAALASLGPPLRKFADDIPKSIEAARPKIAAISSTIGRFTGTQSASPDTSKENRDSTQSDSSRNRAANNSKSDSTAAPNPTGSNDKTQSPITANAPAAATHAIGIAGSLIAEFIEIVLLALFILAAGVVWKEKLVAVRSAAQVNAIAETVGEMRDVVSRYVFVTALINIAQGVVVGVVLKLLDYPSPLLWGVLTFALEFVPYLGGMVVVALLTVAGLAAGRGFPAALAGPAAYLTVTTLQNNVLSPIVYGSRMKLNPTAILLGLMLMYMLWGVAGAFLAVPMLAAFNVLAARVPSLKPVNVFLSD